MDRGYWKNKYGRQCEALDSGSVWMDFLPAGVNKGTALKVLLDRLHIDPSECTAFGDNENDMGMLRLVGCPVVMRHANESIRAVGKYTADTVEEVLEKLLMG